MTNQARPNCGAHHWTATIAYATRELGEGEPLRGITDTLTCGVCGHRYVPAVDGTLRDTMETRKTQPGSAPKPVWN